MSPIFHFDRRNNGRISYILCVNVSGDKSPLFPSMFHWAWIVIRKPKEMWAPSGFEFTSTFRNNHIWYPRIIPMIMQNINSTCMYFLELDLIYPWFVSQKPPKTIFISLYWCPIRCSPHISTKNEFRIWPIFTYWNQSEFQAPLHKQLITLQKFNTPICIDISIKTHQFLCVSGRLKWILYIIWPFNQHFKLKNQRNWLKQVWMLKFWSVINCIFVHWTKKLTLALFCFVHLLGFLVKLDRNSYYV